MDCTKCLHDTARFLSQYGKKWCYDCKHFFYDSFCSYKSCNCRIYGSLDLDQKERHPDVAAMICPNYSQKEGKRWFEKDDE